ncbi:MAG: gliding motility lipoprotein GldH [Bacteroidota bacterium]
MYKTKLAYFLSMFAIAFLYSCNSDKIYEEYKDVNELQWHKTNIISFDVNITDVVPEYKISIAVRFIEGCPYMNFPVNISRLGPDGKTETFSADIKLRDEDENYLGSVIGNIYDLTIPVRENVAFEKPGIYKFTIENSSDQDPLIFISEIGFIIEKQKTE